MPEADSDTTVRRAAAAVGGGRDADMFARARLRLALLFAGLVIALLVVSSLFMYLAIRSDLRQAADRGGEGFGEGDFVAHSLGTLRWQLLAADAAIVVVIGVVGLLYAHSTLRPIRENVAAQRRFIADASHELRTPLSVMKAELEVSLRRLPADAELRPVLVSGLEEVDHMTEMVEDLLTLSRIDAHQEQLVLEPVDLTELARETTARLATMASEAGVTLTFAGQPAPHVRGDARHVRRALANVVRNAIDHSPPESVIAVSVGPAGDGAQATVTDAGEGIRPEVLAHIFDRFYRADPARSQARGGAGLGLAISRWALRAMGGDIEVQSTHGRGTTVTIRLHAA
jgi:signal transduction histidine kinase